MNIPIPARETTVSTGDQCNSHSDAMKQSEFTEIQLLQTIGNTVPVQSSRQVTGICEKQNHLFRSIAKYRQVQDLLKSNPVLLRCVIHIAEGERWRPDEVVTWLEKPQRCVLRRISSVDSQSAVRFLRKIELARADKREIRLILWVTRKPEIRKRLAHLSRIPVGVLAFLQCFPEAAAWPLVYNLPDQLPAELSAVYGQGRRFRAVWQDTIRLAEALEMNNLDQRLANLKSFEELQHCHDTWTSRLNLLANPTPAPAQPQINTAVRPQNNLNHYRFRDPPLPGDAFIRPIRDPETLRAEGRSLSHCVASYINDVLSGRCYIYQVLSPERATLEIILKPRLSIGQCCLKNNKTPSDRTMSMVHQWFTEQSQAHQNRSAD